MKEQRQRLILEIIGQQQIETQEALLAALSARGCRATQATISRDIRDMRLVKELRPDGSYQYVESARKTGNDVAQRLSKIFREGVNGCDVAQNLIVLKTMPGMASAACLALDHMEIPDLVGTLAGDDTALLIMRSGTAAEDFYAVISKMIQ